MCSNITDDGLAHLAKLTFLTQLDLSECNITDAGLVYLARLPLTQLDLIGCNIKDPETTSQIYLIRNLLNQSNQLNICTLFPSLNLNHADLHNLIAEYAR